jgi:hypothetical protein
VGVVSRKVGECMGAAIGDALVDVEDYVGVGVGEAVVIRLLSNQIESNF